MFWEHQDHFSFARGRYEYDSIGLAYTDNRTEIEPTYPVGASVAKRLVSPETSGMNVNVR